MLHTREEVIQRAVREFEQLDRLVSGLSEQDWHRLVPRPEGKDPWTVKDSLAHITHWKADLIRAIRRQPVPVEERGLSYSEGNHLVYMRWNARSPEEVLAWHRQVQRELLETLAAAPEKWFSGRERQEDWPNDLDSHSSYHRIQDIEQALASRPGE